MGLTFTSGSVVSGSHDVVRFGHLRFWAERGLIHIESSIDNSYECISARTALRRMNAISEMLGNTNDRQMHSEDQFDRANRERHLRMLEGLTFLIQKAQVQGMPSDASARRDLVRRRKKTVVVPSTFGGGM